MQVAPNGCPLRIPTQRRPDSQPVQEEVPARFLQDNCGEDWWAQGRHVRIQCVDTPPAQLKYNPELGTNNAFMVVNEVHEMAEGCLGHPVDWREGKTLDIYPFQEVKEFSSNAFYQPYYGIGAMAFSTAPESAATYAHETGHALFSALMRHNNMDRSLEENLADTVFLLHSFRQPDFVQAAWEGTGGKPQSEDELSVMCRDMVLKDREKADKAHLPAIAWHLGESLLSQEQSPTQLPQALAALPEAQAQALAPLLQEYYSQDIPGRFQDFVKSQQPSLTDSVTELTTQLGQASLETHPELLDHPAVGAQRSQAYRDDLAKAEGMGRHLGPLTHYQEVEALIQKPEDYENKYHRLSIPLSSAMYQVLCQEAESAITAGATPEQGFQQASQELGEALFQTVEAYGERKEHVTGQEFYQDLRSHMDEGTAARLDQALEQRGLEAGSPGWDLYTHNHPKFDADVVEAEIAAAEAAKSTPPSPTQIGDPKAS